MHSNCGLFLRAKRTHLHSNPAILTTQTISACLKHTLRLIPLTLQWPTLDLTRFGNARQLAAWMVGQMHKNCG